MGDLKDNNR
jgi:hypothetical protein